MCLDPWTQGGLSLFGATCVCWKQLRVLGPGWGEAPGLTCMGPGTRGARSSGWGHPGSCHPGMLGRSGCWGGYLSHIVPGLGAWPLGSDSWGGLQGNLSLQPPQTPARWPPGPARLPLWGGLEPMGFGCRIPSLVRAPPGRQTRTDTVFQNPPETPAPAPGHSPPRAVRASSIRGAVPPRGWRWPRSLCCFPGGHLLPHPAARTLHGH